MSEIPLDSLPDHVQLRVFNFQLEFRDKRFSFNLGAFEPLIGEEWEEPCVSVSRDEWLKGIPFRKRNEFIRSSDLRKHQKEVLARVLAELEKKAEKRADQEKRLAEANARVAQLEEKFKDELTDERLSFNPLSETPHCGTAEILLDGKVIGHEQTFTKGVLMHIWYVGTDTDKAFPSVADLLQHRQETIHA